MFVRLIYHLLPILLVKGAAQYVQPMPQQTYQQFYPQQQQPMMQMQMPTNLPGSGMLPPMMPHMPHMTMQQPMHLPHMQQMQFPMNGGRLPMVVMPHYTNKKDKKKSKKSKKKSHKRKRKSSSSSDETCSSELEYDYRRNNDVRSMKKRRREVLTPVVSYVTRDGYVVYQKKIKKDKAKDWLELSKGRNEEYTNRKVNRWASDQSIQQ